MTDWIGWAAAAILLATIGRQVYTQWRDRNSQGVSRWLFIGQLAASAGFVVYSWILGSWVFVVTNAMMLVVAAIGQWISHDNRRRAARAKSASGAARCGDTVQRISTGGLNT